MHKLKLTVILCCLVSAVGCSANGLRDIVGNAAAHAAGSEVGYSANQCFVVQQQCNQGYYEEWLTSDGTAGCSCAK